MGANYVRSKTGVVFLAVNLLLFPLILLCSANCAHANTINAASCTDADVQAAINSASNGDTVVVPAGNCTWNTGVNTPSPAKNITIQGAGIGITNITDNASQGAAIVLNGSATAVVRLTGFTFISSASHSNGMVQVYGRQTPNLFDVGFRFDHNSTTIANANGTRGIFVQGIFGVIDHNTFNAPAPSGSIQFVTITGSSDGSDGGFTPWMQPLTLGTINAVYIEDNTFTYVTTSEDSIDAYGGARIVIRHNTFNSAHIGFHGTDSGNRRSMFSFEIYSNTFINNSSTKFRAATIRGGSGVIYNNTYGGTYGSWYGVTLMIYRACPALDSGLSWGLCDGTQYDIGSTDFSSNLSRQTFVAPAGGVKFCSANRDLVCTDDSTCSSAGAGTCSTYFDSSGSGGYACRDQPGVTHGQVVFGVYSWNNSGQGGDAIGTYDGGSPPALGIGNYLQAGRDYFANTVLPGYTAFTYPHPLQSLSTTVAPPTGLTSAVH
jgi:hypothetical protein